MQEVHQVDRKGNMELQRLIMLRGWTHRINDLFKKKRCSCVIRFNKHVVKIYGQTFFWATATCKKTTCKVTYYFKICEMPTDEDEIVEILVR